MILEKLSIKHILWISLALHLCASIFSVGFHHYDEHFQIFEFLNYKLGNISSDQLAWEFRAQMRPWFQVYIFMGIYKVFSFLGISDPFSLAFIFRLFNSLLGVYALYRFIDVLKIWFKPQYVKWAYAALSLSWFTPYMLTRTSSEGFGSVLFILGASFLLTSKKKGMIFWAGALLGASYLAKVQMSVPVAFLWLWHLFYQRDWSKITISALGIAFSIAMGPVIDYFGYGNWTFALYNNYVSNFIGGFRGANSLPWWTYFKWSVVKGIPPYSVFVFIATLWGWVKYRKHPLTWMTLSLIVFHGIVSHKEFRFIFPVLVFTPLYLVLLAQDKENFFNKKIVAPVFKFSLVVNGLFLLIVAFRPSNPAPHLYKYVWNQPDVKKLYAQDENPYSMVGVPIHWYRKKGLEIDVWKDEKEIPQNKDVFVFYKKGANLLSNMDNKSCELKFSAYPTWMVKHFNFGNWAKRSRVWSIFKCNFSGS